MRFTWQQFVGNDNIVSIPISFIRLTGDYAAAAFLAQTVYWQTKVGNREWWKTDDDWTKELHLNRKQLWRIRNLVKEWVKVEAKGLPQRNYYKVDLDELNEDLGNLKDIDDLMATQEHLDVPNGTSVCSKWNSSEFQMEHLPQETTQETTQENKNITPPNPPKGEHEEKTKNVKFDPTSLSLPTAINRQTWLDFCEHRKLIKKPLNRLAATRILRKLNEYEKPNACLDRSIENGWAGVFPLQENQRNGTSISSGGAAAAAGRDIPRPRTHMTDEEMLREAEEQERKFNAYVEKREREKEERVERLLREGPNASNRPERNDEWAKDFLGVKA